MFKELPKLLKGVVKIQVLQKWKSLSCATGYFGLREHQGIRSVLSCLNA